MSPSAFGELRIVVKPSMWLRIGSIFVQPPMTLFFAWLAMEPNQRLGVRLMMLALTACMAVSTVYGLLVLSRTIGRTFEIVLDDRALRVPAILRGIVEEVQLTSITKAAITETRTPTFSFFELRIEARDQKLSVASQLVGTDAFHQLVDALRARGVQIG